MPRIGSEPGFSPRREAHEFRALKGAVRFQSPDKSVPPVDFCSRSEMSGIVFLIEEPAEGGYSARAVGESIFTEEMPC